MMTDTQDKKPVLGFSEDFKMLVGQFEYPLNGEIKRIHVGRVIPSKRSTYLSHEWKRTMLEALPEGAKGEIYIADLDMAYMEAIRFERSVGF